MYHYSCGDFLFHLLITRDIFSLPCFLGRRVPGPDTGQLCGGMDPPYYRIRRVHVYNIRLW